MAWAAKGACFHYFCRLACTCIWVVHRPCAHLPAGPPRTGQEICRDIKKLDYAKKHLTATITALRRLSMLVNAVGACRLARCANGIP